MRLKHILIGMDYYILGELSLLYLTIIVLVVIITGWTVSQMMDIPVE